MCLRTSVGTNDFSRELGTYTTVAAAVVCCGLNPFAGLCGVELYTSSKQIMPERKMLNFDSQ